MKIFINNNNIIKLKKKKTAPNSFMEKKKEIETSTAPDAVRKIQIGISEYKKLAM